MTKGKGFLDGLSGMGSGGKLSAGSGFDDLASMTGKFDGVKLAKLFLRGGRELKARSAYKDIEARHGADVAEAVAATIRAGRNPQPILDRARKLEREQAERDELLRNPPPLHGSARWATTTELGPQLRPLNSFDDPSSILIGTAMDGGRPAGLLHWDGVGHLMTLAPTRTGKAVTSLVPNLLRYRGSCVVLDPKGELYELTSAWRRTLGPVHRLNPFNEGRHPDRQRFPQHGFNPFMRIRRYADARALAAVIYPEDQRAQEFFRDEALNFITPMLWWMANQFPPEMRTFRGLLDLVGGSTDTFRNVTLEGMLNSGMPEVAAAAGDLLKKFPASANASARTDQSSLGTFFNTLNSKLGFWRDPDLLDCLDRDDVEFERLKGGSGQPGATETVYITVPFDQMEPYAPFLRVVFLAALDAMRRNPVEPAVPVLFVMDEFLAMGSFPEFQAAIRTHAGYGVRLWFNLQDLGTLQSHYPGTTWQAFFNTSVKLFFGTDEHFTAELISRILANETVALRATNSGSNLSSQVGGEHGTAGFNFSSGESVNLYGRPLLTPDQVVEELAPWLPDGSRHAIVTLRQPPRPVRVRLDHYEAIETFKARKGPLYR